MNQDSKWAIIQAEDPQFYETILEEINKDAKIYAEEVVKLRKLMDLEEMEELEQLKELWELENPYEQDILELLGPESIDELDYLFEHDFEDYEDYDPFIFERGNMSEFFNEMDFFEEHHNPYMDDDFIMYDYEDCDDKARKKEDSIDGVESCFERGYNLSDEDIGCFYERKD